MRQHIETILKRAETIERSKDEYIMTDASGNEFKINLRIECLKIQMSIVLNNRVVHQEYLNDDLKDLWLEIGEELFKFGEEKIDRASANYKLIFGWSTACASKK